MPYKSNKDLPDKVKNHLPSHAQDIYREAFNHAIKTYEDPDKREDPKEDVETVAHKVAWNAVKVKYEKIGDEWYLKHHK